MPLRRVAETGEELLAQIQEEADRRIVPRELRERRLEYVREKLSVADNVVKLRGPTPQVWWDAAELAEDLRA